MTNEEILKHMSGKLDAELDSAEGYLKMVKNLSSTGYTDEYLASGLVEMAHDEYSHAVFIAKMIENCEGVITKEQNKRIDDLDDEIKRFF